MSSFDWNSESAESLIDAEVAGELISDLQEAWQDKAVKEYPNVAPLRAHLHGNTKQEVLEQAKSMSESLKNATPSPAATVTGGSPALPSSMVGEEDEIAMLRENVKRNPSNQNWSAYLRAKHAKAGIAYPGDGE
jgi:hypothetical protein